MTDAYVDVAREEKRLLFQKITDGDTIDGIKHLAIHFQDESNKECIYQAPRPKKNMVKNTLLKKCYELIPSIGHVVVRASYIDCEEYYEIKKPFVVENRE